LVYPTSRFNSLLFPALGIAHDRWVLPFWSSSLWVPWWLCSI